MIGSRPERKNTLARSHSRRLSHSPAKLRENIHPLIAFHLLAVARNTIVAAFIELLSGYRSVFDLNICCCRLILRHRSSPCRCSSPRDTYQHHAAAFNELLRSCSGFDLKVSHRLSSPCYFVYHLAAAGNIVTAISELLRFGATFSSRFANNNNNNDALVPATKNINRPSMVVNVKVLKKLFSVNNYQKKPRRRMDRACVVGDAIEYNKGAAQNGLNQNLTLQLSCGFPVGKSPGSPGVAVVVERVRIRGLSRFRNLSKFAHSIKVKVLPADPNIRIPNIEICFHRNASLAIGMCSQGQWEKVTKGSWIRSMSLFDHKLLDIRTASSTLASSLSKSLAFYYSSAMTIGIILVILMILYQVFAAPYSLRLPRIDRVRYDKAWYECLDVQ
ncbi:hypothetical protein HN51_069990, partial [Arachis hypogaea]